MSTSEVLTAINELATKIAANTSAENFNAETPFVALPPGYQVHNLENYVKFLDARLPTPRRVKKSMTFIDVDSFVSYFTKFKAGHQPQLFAAHDTAGLSIMCVFDYDEAGDGKTPTTAAWNTNLAYLRLAYSRDYQEMRNKADRWFGQEEFALFVEENTHLFIKPDGATMLELAQELKGVRNVAWQSGKSLHNGQVSIEYIETLEAVSKRGAIVVPQHLELKMPMYEGFKDMPINAAFRWKLNEQKRVEFSYRLLTKVAERTAEDDVKKSVTKATGLPLLAVGSFAGITMA